MPFPEDSVERFILNARKSNAFINGDEFTDVETDGGLVPSIRKQLKMIEDDITEVVGPIIETIEEAGALALQGSVRFNQAQVLTESNQTQARENIGIDIPNLPDMKPCAVFDFTLGFVDDRLTETRTTDAYDYNESGVSVLRASGVPRLDINPLTGKINGYLSEQAVDYLPVESETFSNWGAGADCGGGFGAAAIAPNNTNTAISWVWPSSTSSFAYCSSFATANGTQQATFDIWIRKKTGSATLCLSLSDLYTTTESSAPFTVNTEWKRLNFISTNLVNTGLIGWGFNSAGASTVVAGDEFELWHPAVALGRHPNLSYRPTIGTPIHQNSGGLLLDLTAETDIVNPNEFTIIAVIDTTKTDAARQSVIFNLGDATGNESLYVDTSNSFIRGFIASALFTTSLQKLAPLAPGRHAVGITVSKKGIIGLTSSLDTTPWIDTNVKPPLSLLTMGIGRYSYFEALETGVPIERVVVYKKACTQLALKALLTYWNRG